MTKSQKITPCLWFDSDAEAAAHFYAALFDDSSIAGILRYGDEGREITGKPAGSVMTVDFQLAGYKFVGLNGGPQFAFTPAISFFVMCESEAEVDTLWEKLSRDGGVLMELGRYDWSEKYGWVKDKYGLTWQIALGRIADVGQKITPSLLFAGKPHGRAEQAINLYTKIFRDSKIDGILRHTAHAGGLAGSVKHAQFGLNNEKFMAMDGGLGHAFGFNEAISLQIACESQQEVDYFWAKLTANGGEEGPCGWVKDKFGVSWQVVPAVLREWLSDPDTAKTNRLTRAYLQMKKFDIGALQRAYAGEAP